MKKYEIEFAVRWRGKEMKKLRTKISASSKEEVFDKFYDNLPSNFAITIENIKICINEQSKPLDFDNFEDLLKIGETIKNATTNAKPFEQLSKKELHELSSSFILISELIDQYKKWKFKQI